MPPASVGFFADNGDGDEDAGCTMSEFADLVGSGTWDGSTAATDEGTCAAMGGDGLVFTPSSVGVVSLTGVGVGAGTVVGAGVVVGVDVGVGVGVDVGVDVDGNGNTGIEGVFCF